MTKHVATIIALALCLGGCSFLPPQSDPVQLLTSPERVCFAADAAGLLVVDPTYGTAIVGDGHPNMLVGGDLPVTVAWPPGFTARRNGSEVAVLNPQGRVVGTTGRSYEFLAGYVGAGGSSGIVWPELKQGVLLSCGNLTEERPFVPPTQDEIREAAGRAYAQAIIPIDRARNEVLERYKNRTSLKEWKTYCWKLAYVERDFLVALKGITYPDDAKLAAKALIHEVATQVADLRTCAKAPDRNAVNRAIDLANKDRDRAHDALNLVRLDLGLDPLPG